MQDTEYSIREMYGLWDQYWGLKTTNKTWVWDTINETQPLPWSTQNLLERRKSKWL
jgi:hypothetical protein